MKPEIGLQLYSLREKCSENFENVLKEVSKAGYDGVEFYSFFDIPAADMKEMLKRYNLKAMGTHTNTDILNNDLDKLIKYCNTLESEYVGLGMYTAEDRDGWLRFSEMAEKWGEKLRRNGISFLYHNHAHEFEPVFNGEMAEDIILKNTSPENASLELDCFWVTHAGLKPEEYLTENLSRIKTIHIKDMENMQEKKMTEVGTGIIDCGKLYDIAARAGFKWVAVEQDNIYIDPFESIRISIGNLRK
ncbi:MAG: Xylose isomerase domain protein barrel [Eubacterium sp.]|jgi:sugar phosphate isomerase/epimerase|nr:Xylose isomerase domain protein barrel [Eubacterium sp.]